MVALVTRAGVLASKKHERALGWHPQLIQAGLEPLVPIGLKQLLRRALCFKPLGDSELLGTYGWRAHALRTLKFFPIRTERVVYPSLEPHTGRGLLILRT